MVGFREQEWESGGTCPLGTFKRLFSCWCLVGAQGKVWSHSNTSLCQIMVTSVKAHRKYVECKPIRGGIRVSMEAFWGSGDVQEGPGGGGA